MKKLLLVLALICFAGIVFADTATVTATITETVTQTITATVTETVTETVTQTVTETITATNTATITPTLTPTVHIYGNTVYQPVAQSGKFEIYNDTSFRIFGKTRWVNITIDSLVNTTQTIGLYEGDVLLRTLNIYTLPYTVDMGNRDIKNPIIDYGKNTGTSTTELKK